MSAVIDDQYESSEQRSSVGQVIVTLFLGIPMTAALAIGLAFYCTYECVKHLLTKQRTRSVMDGVAQNKAAALKDEEQTFTAALTTLAKVHQTEDRPLAGPVLEVEKATLEKAVVEKQ